MYNFDFLRDDTMNIKRDYEDDENKLKSKNKYKGPNRINPTEDTPLLNKILMKRDTLFQYYNKVHFEKMIQKCLIKINYGTSSL
jgi:hypothetical protein